MCLTCGCGTEEMRVDGVPVEHEHHHDLHDHRDHHDHRGPDTETLVVEERLTAKNDALAEHVRAFLAVRRIRGLNLMSSPGAGKTSLLERTVAALGGGRDICVIEGDQETSVDADRIVRAGARAVQVNTGAGCHLDADMVHRALHRLDPAEGSLLFIENVGNLVCPALFDLGEAAKVVVISVTEGDDKPVKYPHMFAAADVVVVNKTDLLPHVDLDLDRLVAQAHSLRPDVTVLPLSVRTGDGFEDWLAWLEQTVPDPRGAVRGSAVRS